MVLRLASAFIVVSMVFGLTSAQAQRGVAGWADILPAMSKRDIALAEKQARDELTGKPAGTVLAWQNPRSGRSGTVRLVSNYQWKGYQCRKVVHAFHMSKQDKNQGQQNWEISLCLVDGEWKWPVPPKKL